MVMELLQGESLAPVIARGPLDVDRALHVMIQIARGVARAHDLDIIHRDIKPENIFLVRRDDGSDLVKVLDFGIAKSRQDSRLTTQGELFGTPQYMAPERITGKDTGGGASDIYALGVVFYEMLSGELPFTAPDVATFFIKHMEEMPRPVRSLNNRVPQELDDLVLRMLAKSASDRPVDAHRIHQDLLAIMKEREAAPPPSADEDMEHSIAPVTLAAGPADQWARRMFVLEQMLTTAFGPKAKAPAELNQILDQANEIVREVVGLRMESFKHQEKIQSLDQKGREKRAQLGFAVDQLGVDASKAKEELRSARETQKRAEEET
jgi:serine/threonine-protein kinase